MKNDQVLNTADEDEIQITISQKKQTNQDNEKLSFSMFLNSLDGATESYVPGYN